MKRKLSEKDQKALQAFQEKIKSCLGANLLRLALFGSKAEGRDVEGSDIDVLVLVKRTEPGLKKKVIDIAFDVNIEFAVYISPRVISSDIFNHPVWRLTPFLQKLKDKAINL